MCGHTSHFASSRSASKPKAATSKDAKFKLLKEQLALTSFPDDYKKDIEALFSIAIKGEGTGAGKLKRIEAKLKKSSLPSMYRDDIMTMFSIALTGTTPD